MKNFLISLTATLLLLIVWFTTYLTAAYPAQPHLYIQVAPWWHIMLHIAWLGSLWVTAVCAIYWYWDNRLRWVQ